MGKYSKLRFVFMALVLFLGFGSIRMGFALYAVSKSVVPYMQRGLDARIVQIEKDHDGHGLKENFDQQRFNESLTGLKAGLLRIQNGEAFGAWGMFWETLTLWGCFSVGILYLVSVLLLSMRHPLFDVCVKASMAAVAVFVISLLVSIWNQVTLMAQTLEGITRLHVMVKDIEVHVVSRDFVLRSMMFSPVGIFAGIIMPIVILILYIGLPFGLYLWMKNRGRA